MCLEAQGETHLSMLLGKSVCVCVFVCVSTKAHISISKMTEDFCEVNTASTFCFLNQKV